MYVRTQVYIYCQHTVLTCNLPAADISGLEVLIGHDEPFAVRFSLNQNHSCKTVQQTRTYHSVVNEKECRLKGQLMYYSISTK